MSVIRSDNVSSLGCGTILRLRTMRHYRDSGYDDWSVESGRVAVVLILGTEPLHITTDDEELDVEAVIASFAAGPATEQGGTDAV